MKPARYELCMQSLRPFIPELAEDRDSDVNMLRAQMRLEKGLAAYTDDSSSGVLQMPRFPSLQEREEGRSPDDDI